MILLCRSFPVIYFFVWLIFLLFSPPHPSNWFYTRRRRSRIMQQRGKSPIMKWCSILRLYIQNNECWVKKFLLGSYYCWQQQQGGSSNEKVSSPRWHARIAGPSRRSVAPSNTRTNRLSYATRGNPGRRPSHGHTQGKGPYGGYWAHPHGSYLEGARDRPKHPNPLLLWPQTPISFGWRDSKKSPNLGDQPGRISWDSDHLLEPFIRDRIHSHVSHIYIYIWPPYPPWKLDIILYPKKMQILILLQTQFSASQQFPFFPFLKE